MKFSASPMTSGKGYYKNFAPHEALRMEDMLTYMRQFSLSSYLYTEAITETAGGEKCSYRRAGECVVGAGDVMFFDFDSKYKPVTFEELYEYFRGVSSCITPSKGWSEEVEKYHVAVALDRPLPMNKLEFVTWYRAVAQFLGIDGLYDPAMESWVQNLAPHGRAESLDAVIKGDAVNVDEVLAAYVPIESAQEGGSGYAGDIDTVFTLSRGQEQLDTVAMIEKVMRDGKQRVWCAAGLEHDGRKDTAFVDEHEGEVFYHCSGGRCGHTMRLAINPFVPEGKSESVEVLPETLLSIIEHSREFAGALADDAPAAYLNSAINYALDETAKRMGVAKVEGTIRRFTGVYWREAFASKESIRRFLRDELLRAGFHAKGYSQATTESAFKYFVNHIEPKELEATGRNCLNLSNGVLDIDTGMLGPHDASMLFTSVLPYRYDAAAKAPVWEVVVDRVMCGDKDTMKAFKQAMGYLLLRSFNVEKMVGFVGEGENGKSTVFKVLKKLVGRSGYSAQPIQGLLKQGSEGHYAKAQLAGKLVNITNELAPASLEADAFKDLISGEDIIARNIFEAPFTLATTPKQVVAMNSTDNLVKERTHGFTRRLHLIPFNYTLKEEHKDPDLDKKLEAELPGILNWCLEGAKEVMEQGKLFESMAMKRLFEAVKRDSNPVQQFVEERVRSIEGELDYDSVVISGAAIHLSYKNFCLENGYLPMGRNRMMNELKRLGIRFFDTSKSDNGRPTKRFRGFHCELLPDDSGFTAEVIDIIRKK